MPYRQKKDDAIIDNDVLVNLTTLSTHPGISFDALAQLRHLFARIHIPVEVKSEYERASTLSPYRQKILARLRPDQGFFSLCTHFDSIVKAVIETQRWPGLHAGEAEAIAQAEKIIVYTFLTDDVSCTNVITAHFSHIRCCNTLYLLAALDLNDFLPDRDAVFAILLQIRPFTSRELREAYLQVAGHYGLQLNKKTLSLKSSLKRLRSA